MARTKYKLGSYVRVAETDECPSAFGRVQEVRLTEKGTLYKIDTLDDPIAEESIEVSYREVVSRPRKQLTEKKVSKRKSSQRQTEAQAAA